MENLMVKVYAKPNINNDYRPTFFVQGAPQFKIPRIFFFGRGVAL